MFGWSRGSFGESFVGCAKTNLDIQLGGIELDVDVLTYPFDVDVLNYTLNINIPRFILRVTALTAEQLEEA